MKSLYKINEDYLDIIRQVEIQDGEITPEQEQLLSINQSELQQKSIAYLEVIQDREDFAKRIDLEIKRLQQLKKQQVNLVERLKNNLLNAVKSFGSFEVGLTKFSTRKSSSIVVSCDVNKLPKQYKVIKVTETADKTALKNAIKSGESIEGVELVENENLKIN